MTKLQLSAGSGVAHAWVVTASGEIDASSCHHLDEKLNELIDGGARLLILDLRDVEFIDSSGLRTIVAASNRLIAERGQLLVQGVSGAVERVLQITGLLEHLRGGRPRQTASPEPRRA
ncbi:MAG: STAS domain-containing protein [Acidimicrobiales bacterium]